MKYSELERILKKAGCYWIEEEKKASYLVQSYNEQRISAISSQG